MSRTFGIMRSTAHKPGVVTVMLLALGLILATSAARADPPTANQTAANQAAANQPPAPAQAQAPAPYMEEEEEFESKVPQRERDFVQIIENARKAAKQAHSSKDARMDLQIRVTNFYNQSHDFVKWQGTVVGTSVADNGDVWISIKITDGVTISTSPTRADDPHYVTLIKPGSPIAKIATKLRAGQPVVFSATLMRYVNDSDDDMINNPRLLGHFTELKALQQ